MPVRLNSSGGGSVTLDVPAVGTTTTLNLPTSNGTLLASDGSGNVTVSGAATFSGNATFNAGLIPSSSFLRNRLINGGFDVWQRGTSTSSVNVYLADRWIVTAGGSLTTSQSSDVPAGFRFSLSLAGSSFPQAQQRIESANCFDLVGQNVTLSFWVKQTVGAGSNSLGIQLYRANAVDNFGTNTLISEQFLTGSTSWTRYTATFNNLPAAAANGLLVLLYANTGGSATFLMTGVQLEVGSVATPFERRQFGQELALCQRYFFKSFDLNTVPGTIGAASHRGLLSTSSFRASHSFLYPVTMRTSPTITFYNPNTGVAGSAYNEDIGTNPSVTPFIVSQVGLSGIDISPSAAFGNCILVTFVASAEL